MNVPARTVPFHDHDAEGLMAQQWLSGWHADPSLARGEVALWRSGSHRPDGHMAGTHEALARWVARLRGDEYIGVREPDPELAGRPTLATTPGPAGWTPEVQRRPNDPRRPRYWVPTDTIIAPPAHWSLLGEDDLLGGVVPLDFVATKVVTHPLVAHSAVAPAGWRHNLGAALRCIVLPGYSAFSHDDALLAGMRLLHDGPVRVKKADGIGGAGQARVRDLAELEALLGEAPAGAFNGGWVLERDLADLRTLSVGQVRLAGQIISYVGTQRLVRNRHGESVYGGSRLHVVRGDYDALAQQDLDEATLLGVHQAREYDERVKSAYPGSFATRSNYDVAQGFDHAGHWHSGVLEQSWRIGGATGAELLAMQLLRDEPERESVDAATVEVHGRDVALPPGAVLLYNGDDPDQGWMTKYAVQLPDGAALADDAHGAANEDAMNQDAVSND